MPWAGGRAKGRSQAASTTVNLSVANATTLFNSGNFAFNNLAGPNGNSTTFDFGMPFFFGRTVYYGIDQTATGGQAPFVAF